jgi:hypothetical protein
MLGTYNRGPPEIRRKHRCRDEDAQPLLGLCGEERGRGAADGRTPLIGAIRGLKVNTFWWLALRSPSMASSTSRVMSPVG